MAKFRSYMKQHHYKETDLLACSPIILMLAYCRAVEGYRYRLLTTYLTLEAVASLPQVVSSRQI